MTELAEEEISIAFMHYLEDALVVFEDTTREMTNRERIEVYYHAYKESVKELYRRKTSNE